MRGNWGTKVAYVHQFTKNNEFNLRWLMNTSMHIWIQSIKWANDQESAEYQEKVNLAVIVRGKKKVFKFNFHLFTHNKLLPWEIDAWMLLGKIIAFDSIGMTWIAFVTFFPSLSLTLHTCLACKGVGNKFIYFIYYSSL